MIFTSRYGVKRKILITATVVLLSSTPASSKPFFDQWLSESTSYTAPGYFEGQKRGFATAGSYSARWPTSVDYPLTIQAPRLKFGCGGIDAMWGGISFLNLDQLTDKLQRIAQNSMAVAFDMAFETLCSKCSQITKSFESIINQLNGLSINDCTAARSLTNAAAGSKIAQDTKEWIQGSALSKNLNEGASYINKELTAAPGSNVRSALDWFNGVSGSDPTKDATKKSCPSDVKSMFPVTLDGPPVYLLDDIGNKLGLPSDHIRMVRGLIGDVKISNADQGYKIVPIASCSENANLTIDQLKNGEVYVKTGETSCQPMTDAHRKLVDYVATTANAIATKIANRQALSTSEVSFIMNSPLPVHTILKAAVGSGQQGVIVNNLSNILANFMVAKIMQDLMARSETMIQKVQEINVAKLETGTDCNVGVVQEAITDNIGLIRERNARVISLITNAVNSEIHNHLAMMNMVKQFEEVQGKVRKIAAARLGSALVDRAMK